MFLCGLVEIARLFGASPAVLCDTLVVIQVSLLRLWKDDS